MHPGLMPPIVSVGLALEKWYLELEANGRDHHTAELCLKQLVVRRGQPFRLTLRFQGRSYEARVDHLTFIVSTGKYRQAPAAAPALLCALTVPPLPPQTVEQAKLPENSQQSSVHFPEEGPEVQRVERCRPRTHSFVIKSVLLDSLVPKNLLSSGLGFRSLVLISTSKQLSSSYQ